MSSALLIIDVQPTFCEGGELPVEGGNAVAERIAEFISEHGEKFDLLISTQDWHINPGTHFSNEPDFINSWPVHGVAGTPSAEIHPALSQVVFDYSIKKGQYETAYSGFDGLTEASTSLEAILNWHDIDRVFIVGLAESHCVAATALDAARLDFETYVIQELTAPVSEELGLLARESMEAGGVVYVSTNDF